MYSIPEDVYSEYPEISRALPSVSKELSSLASKGACKSFIRGDEIISYIENTFLIN